MAGKQENSAIIPRIMTRASYGEADTRAKLITPALRQKGWGEELIDREVPVGKGAVEIGHDGIPRRANPRPVDYLLKVIVRENTEPVPVAILEAKKESLSPDAGLQQACEYASSCHVPFAFSSNGHLFSVKNMATGAISQPQEMSAFPRPDQLWQQYKEARGFPQLDEFLPRAPAIPLLTRYSPTGENRRYYQDAAIRAAMEKIVRCEETGEPRRILLPLATGAGKTFIAVNLLHRIASAKKLRCVLFLCDRKELREQAFAEFTREFGGDAVVVSNQGGENPAKNAKIHIATYQTLGVGRDADNPDPDAVDDGATFNRFYPEEDYFSHIVIDECHRSAWGEWSLPLRRNPRAVHIGLTATPRTLKIPKHIYATEEGHEDKRIDADNIKHFGEPVYEYPIVRGMDDGYLAMLLLDKARTNVDMAGGISGKKLAELKPTYANTGDPVPESELRPHYPPQNFEKILQLPDRVHAMCADLFQKLCEDDPKNGPDQKTIIFCETIQHADDVVREMQNLREQFVKEQGGNVPDQYAFKCTADVDGAALISGFRNLPNSRFIAATVDLLATGVDIPRVRNIVFFRHIKSPILFHQMLGRGTRIDEESGKLAFTVYDYTNATVLMGEELATRARLKKKPDGKEPPEETDDSVPVRKIRADGLDVWVNDFGRFVMADGQFISQQEYENRIAKRLREEVRNFADFNARWIDRDRREEMMQFLVKNELSPSAALMADRRDSEDLYDYLADVVWDADPKTRRQRADAFFDINAKWLASFPPDAAATISAIIAVFADGGTEELETSELFIADRVRRPGGQDALIKVGPLHKTMTEMKRRLFAA